MSNFTYSVITPIKESNKGKVYLAKLEGYDFPVIVKELKHGNQAVFQALSELDNEYVPKIYKIEASADGLVVAEEYIEGETLAEHLAAGKLTAVEWIGIAKQLCEALSTLHAHVPPLIHRDIKPSNIIINSKGRVKLIDFDSSRLYKVEAEEDTRLLGTERYAPPEQYGFSQTDCRSDIYSMGVVFDRFSEFIGKNGQRSWRQLVEKCTSFSPDSRYQSVEEITKEIKKIEKAGLAKRWKIGAGICVGVLLFSLGFFRLSDLFDKSIGIMQTPANESGQSKNNPASENEYQEESQYVAERDEKTESAEIEEDEEKEQKPEATEQADSSQYSTIPPEWRDIETDSPGTVALKKRIREQNLMVMYCFKDRLLPDGFLLHCQYLDHKDRELVELKFTLLTTGDEAVVEEKYVEVKDQLLFIDDEYMMSLAEGYYNVRMRVKNENGGKVDSEMILYVAQSDVLEEPESWLQNTTLSYYGTQEEKLHVVVKNDSVKAIAGMVNSNRSVVDASLYKVLYGGRVLEFSNELLNQYSNNEMNFWISSTDGTWLNVRINNRSK